MSCHNRLIDKLYVHSVTDTKNDNKRNRTMNKFKLKNINIINQNEFNPRKTYFNRGMGSVIMQSWNTSTNVPKDIGMCLDLPMIVDRKKIKKMKMSLQKKAVALSESVEKGKYKDTDNGFKMNKGIMKMKRKDYLEIEQIRYAGENMIKKGNNVSGLLMSGKKDDDDDSRKVSGNYYNKRYKQIMLSPTTNPTLNRMRYKVQYNYNYKDQHGSSSSNNKAKTNRESMKQPVISSPKLLLPHNNEHKQQHNNNNNNNILPLTTTTPSINYPSPQPLQQQQQLSPTTTTTTTPATTLINFTTFTQHLYLKDNEFLYAIRNGGPLDYQLCSYTSISKIHDTSKPKSHFTSHNYEYLTISKTTIIHSHNNTLTSYPISSWIAYYNNYQQIISIPLFKNFKLSRIFELWRKHYRKSTRKKNREKLLENFQLIDTHLLSGLRSIRQILEHMQSTLNIFSFEGLFKPVFSTTFKELHQHNSHKLDLKMESYRQSVKDELKKALMNSYNEYKNRKRINLEDTEIDPYKQEEKLLSIKNSMNNNTKRKEYYNKLNTETIPFAQDATRKTHYKKLLRFIRGIDYLFNDAKYKLIRNSLMKLNIKFNNLCEAYENNYGDSPMIIVTLFTMQDQIEYNPNMIALYDLIFEQFIQENIYTVIYKKSFVDPQEFPQFMVVFEEVFETSVDQNANLNNRIKDDQSILKLFTLIKNSFDKCKCALNNQVDNLMPILHNYNIYERLSFTEIEEHYTSDKLKELKDKIIKEYDIIQHMKRIISIGIFEFDISELQDLVIDAPFKWLNKLRHVIPRIISNKVSLLINLINHHLNIQSISVSNVESFIKLKKAVEACAKERSHIDALQIEITDLLELAYSDKHICLTDYDQKLITQMKAMSVEFERKYDLSSYYIENNITQYRIDLKTAITVYDNTLKEMLSTLNDDIVNKYNIDATVPLLHLDNQETSIKQVIKQKETYQQLEIDLEMDECEKCSFDNVDMLTYQYNLKRDLWTSVNEIHQLQRGWNSYQVQNLNLNEMNDKLNKWSHLCKVALIDLDYVEVPQGILNSINKYERVLPVLEAMQNKNVISNDIISEKIKLLLKIDNDFNDAMLTLHKVLSIKHIYEVIDDISELNHQANEEKKLKDLLRKKTDEFEIKRLLFKFRQNSENKNDKFVHIEISKESLDKEFEYIESNLLLLQKCSLNPSSHVVSKDILKLIDDLTKYMEFLYLFCEYQNTLHKCQGVLFNSEFIKEMPTEQKKIINENQLRYLMKLLKDNYTLKRFMRDNVYTKCKSTLCNLLESLDKNYYAINTYLNKKRKEFPKYFALSDEDLISLYEQKESTESKTKLVYKLYPWIKQLTITGESTSEEYLELTTIENEVIVIKVTKTSKTLRDIVDLIEYNVPKKIKELIKGFKKDYESSSKSKADKKIKEIINELILNKEMFAQCVFCNVFYYMMDIIDKALLSDNDAFDKLFDIYHEHKDEFKEMYIRNAKDMNNTLRDRMIYLALVSLENNYINIIEDLIREDVQENTEYNYVKLINPKIENDSFYIHIMNMNIEYGFEYTGNVVNYYQSVSNEKLILKMISMFNNKTPYIITCEHNMKHALNYVLYEMVYKIIGRNCNLLICNNDFNEFSLNSVMYSNFKSGGWICLDKVNVLSNEILSVLVNRIKEVYMLIRSSEEEGFYMDRNDKIPINTKNYNISMIYYSDTGLNSGNEDDKEFQYVSFEKVDYEYFIKVSLLNLVFEDYEQITKKVIEVFKVVVLFYNNSDDGNNNNRSCIIDLMVPIFIKMLNIIKKKYYINIMNKQNENEYIRKAIEESVYYFLSQTQIEELSKIINTLFPIESNTNMHSLSNININQNDLLINTLQEDQKTSLNEFDFNLKQILTKYHFQDNSAFELKLKYLHTSLPLFNSFIILGPSLSGKTTLLHLYRTLSISLFNINQESYKQFLYQKISPNATDPENIFTRQIIYENTYDIKSPKHTHSIQQFIFVSLLKLFNYINRENFYRFNEFNSEIYNQHCSLDINDEPPSTLISPSIAHNTNCSNNHLINQTNTLKSYYDEDTVYPRSTTNIFRTKTIDNMNNDNNNNTNINDLNVDPTIINAILFDECELDSKWLHYLSLFDDKDNKLTLSNGHKIDMSNYKLLFETCSLRKASPDFCTRHCLITLDNTIFTWENILYNYLETNNKVNENSELKNYIRGLFENYFPSLWDFLESNQLTQITVNENYAIKNLIILFDSILPIFDFNDNKIGRKNLHSAPKIETIKANTLSIFIFSFAWTVANLSNFVIRIKIEKLISDVFKADDLKGPIFDYYINPNTFTFEHWDSFILSDDIYNTVLTDTDKLFHYDKFFVPNQHNIPYVWIANKYIKANVPFMLCGKSSTGKSILMSFLFDKNNSITNTKTSNVNLIKFLVTPNAKSVKLQQHILNKTKPIRRDIIGDEYGRKVILYIDDVHLSSFNFNNSNQIHEYIRHLIDTKSIYNMNNNMITFLYKFNVITCGNITPSFNCNETYVNGSFNRLIMKTHLMLLDLKEETMINIYKPTFEYHLRQYIPNTSSITASQYIQVLLKLYKYLSEVFNNDATKHIVYGLSDVTKIIQAFHVFNFKGGSDYPDYLKKLFFYESTRVLSDKILNENEVKLFRTKLCEAYSSIFKQDKVTVEQIFVSWDKELTYMFSNNYFMKGISNNSQFENVYYVNRGTFVDELKLKMKAYNEMYNKKMKYNYVGFEKVIINDTNVDFIVKILRAMEKPRKNVILIGNKYSCKETLFDLACYISCFKVLKVNPIYNSKSTKCFVNEIINNNLLIDVVFNNKPTFLFIPYALLTSQHLIEIINSLYNINEIPNNFDFINSKVIETYGGVNLELNEIQRRIYSNLHFCLTIEPNTEAYYTLFTKYPFITKNSSIIARNSWNENDYGSYCCNIYKDILSSNEIKPNIKDTSLFKLMYNIHSYADTLYKDISIKQIKLNAKLTPYHFVLMCEYYMKHYVSYKQILETKLEKYNSACSSIIKCDEVIRCIKNEINELIPLKEQSENDISEIKNLKSLLNSEKSLYKLKKADEEKPMHSLESEQHEKEEILNQFLTPILNQISKTLKPLKDLQEKDIVEIKNTYENFVFGKYLLSKVFEIINNITPTISSNTISKDSNREESISQQQSYAVANSSNEIEWDTLKKNLNIKTLQRFFNMKITSNNELLKTICNEICAHSDFGLEDKYQKPFRACALLCAYFKYCKEYFDVYATQSSLIEVLDNIKSKIINHQVAISDIIQNIKRVDKELENADFTLISLDKTRLHYVNLIEKKNILLDIIKKFMSLTNQKFEMWKHKREDIEQIYNNYDFYLLYICAYLSYAPILNKYSRNKFNNFLYSDTINIKKALPIEMSDLMLNFIDIIGKDKKLALVLQNFQSFDKENFLFMHIFKNRLPYIIDTFNQHWDTITQFIEGIDTRSITKAIHNEKNLNEMVDQLEASMKNGLILFISECTKEITYLLHDIIISKTNVIYINKNKVNVYNICNRNIEHNELFKLFLIKGMDIHNENEGEYVFNEDDFINTLIINFDREDEQQTKEEEVKEDTENKEEKSEDKEEKEKDKAVAMKKIKNDIYKTVLKLYESENRMINSIKAFDYTNSVDKITYNQSVLDNYERDVYDDTSMKNNIVNYQQDLNDLIEGKVKSENENENENEESEQNDNDNDD